MSQEAARAVLDEMHAKAESADAVMNTPENRRAFMDAQAWCGLTSEDCELGIRIFGSRDAFVLAMYEDLTAKGTASGGR